jgi:predicted CopG family antitoxin
MAYDRVKIFEDAKSAIEKNKLFFIEDVLAFVPCAKSTFYEFFPDKSEESDVLKELLGKNKTEVKVSMRSKWYKSDNPTLQVALMKIIATDDEAHRLNGSKSVLSLEGGEKPIIISFED